MGVSLRMSVTRMIVSYMTESAAIVALSTHASVYQVLLIEGDYNEHRVSDVDRV